MADQHGGGRQNIHKTAFLRKNVYFFEVLSASLASLNRLYVNSAKNTKKVRKIMLIFPAKYT